MNIVDQARKFAERAHRSQARKYTGEPYFVHLDEVAKLCRRHGSGKPAIAAAYLHDVLEDQPVTFEDLVGAFGPMVAGIVRELTDMPASAGPRKQRKTADTARLAIASASAQTIKCADLISNTSSIVRHDPGFARTYLAEKRNLLPLLTRAIPTLKALAWERLIQAESEIERK